MDANDIASAIKSSLEGRVQYMLMERLRNFSNEARILIKEQKGIKLNECDTLWLIFKSLKDVSREMILELIRNSSLHDDDKALLNVVFGDPRVNVFSLTKTTTREEVFGDELSTGSKTPVLNEPKEWPRKDLDVSDLD
ncbi:MAG: hypothetical protein UT90_C0021G0006 [Parcubacteria group bacterium GW2011_GWA1_40_21]|nr:MAG: hypothetical protein UT90_C0021G0006 [Parcubacteria group bacterium GW2011_GWA1_40_21]